MQERTIYEADDGTQFTDPDLCRRYEHSRTRWQAALTEVGEPPEENWSEHGLDLREWLPGPRNNVAGAQLFLARLKWLQRFAAFMAAEDP